LFVGFTNLSQLGALFSDYSVHDVIFEVGLGQGFAVCYQAFAKAHYLARFDPAGDAGI
jgi:hypothetical protein